MLWTVEIDGKDIVIGGRRRTKLHPSGCNQPYRNAFWCPKKHWFQSKPCPFVNRRECDNYARMCGSW